MINSNAFIQKNYIGAILLIVVLIFLFFTFGRKTQVRTVADSSRSFIGTDYGDAGNAVVNDGSIMSPVAEPIMNQPVAQNTANDVIWWCGLMDGANHIPDYFGEGFDNHVGGTNWHSYAKDDPKGPQGIVTENGKTIFFIKKSYLDSHGASPVSMYLKSKMTGNNPIPMTWAKVAGEPAWVYVK